MTKSLKNLILTKTYWIAYKALICMGLLAYQSNWNIVKMPMSRLSKSINQIQELLTMSKKSCQNIFKERAISLKCHSVEYFFV